MRDLRIVNCEHLLTITQYLRPDAAAPSGGSGWVKPEEFVELREEALGLGFAGVMSGPLVRSSYRAGRLYAQAISSSSSLMLSKSSSIRARTSREIGNSPASSWVSRIV